MTSTMAWKVTEACGRDSRAIPRCIPAAVLAAELTECARLGRSSIERGRMGANRRLRNDAQRL